jgi:hypothetical protein
MKITFNHHVLARGASHHEHPVHLRVLSHTVVQSVYAIGAKSAQRIDRGNRHHELHFQVVRKHPSIEAALQHALLYTSALQGLEGDFRAISEGEAPVCVALGSAVLKAVQTTVNGPVTVDHYEIVGGDFSLLDTRTLHNSKNGF